MHIRYSRAAVDFDSGLTSTGRRELERTSSSSTGRPSTAKPLPTLWASRALPVGKGRLVGVRLSAGTIQAALVASGADGLRWVDADTVLTETQVRLWLRIAQFSRSSR